MKSLSIEGLPGLRVTVMGLGLNGGGLASALFFAAHGAEVTVTDLRDAATLAPSIAALEGRRLRYVLGRHELADFSGADLVIKNPAVKPGSPFLAAARDVETDVSVFLRLARGKVVAVTGSKGKSSTASAVHHGLAAAGRRAFLGGNITVSPLGFLDETSDDSWTVLELSSWQLADMRGMGVLRPAIAAITSIMPDHLNHYSSMNEYVADKRLVYADQGPADWTICLDDGWGRSFQRETPARPLALRDVPPPPGAAGAWLEGGKGYIAMSGGEGRWVLDEELAVPGAHQRSNLLMAAVACSLAGVSDAAVRSAMASFPGVEHRLEFVAERKGARWYNDSAATIPQACMAAIRSFDEPLVLIAGGTDKALDFAPLAEAAREPKAIVLLAGSGTDKLVRVLAAAGRAYEGPYGDLGSAVERARDLASPGDVIVLSPGCASFGMFLNEFDRGRKFKEAVLALPE